MKSYSVEQLSGGKYRMSGRAAALRQGGFMPVKVTAGFLFVLISPLLTPVFAQRTGGSASASVNAQPSAASASSASTTGNKFYSGQVAVADGGAIPFERVTIESNCGGTIRKETTADSKGSFGFTLGGGSGNIMLEASNDGRHAGVTSSLIDIKSCVVTAVLPGFFSDTVYLASLDPTKPSLGTIILRRAAPAAPGTVSALSAKAPKDAKKAFDNGAEAAKGRKFEDAIKSYQKAVQSYPAYAEALCEMGKAQAALNRTDEARKSFEASAKADPQYTAPLLQLADLENKAQNWKGMVEYTTRVLQIAPGALPDIYLADAMARFRMRDVDGVDKSARDGIKADTQHRFPKLYQLAALASSAKGNDAAAVEQLKLYLQYAENPPDAATVRSQITELEKKTAAAPRP
jgi:hypothetical protein